MRYFISILASFGLIHFGFGQATTSQNYVMTNTVKQSGVVTESGVNALTIATQGKSQQIDYFDGLGRAMQHVITQGSAAQHDIVTGVEYDAYGREVKKYLPYSDIANTTTAGGYRSGWKTVQASFYSSAVMPNVDASASPYGVSVMEPSPLNRIAAQGAPGDTWQPNLTTPYDPASHSVQTQYLINKLEDNIRKFYVNNAGVIASATYYAAGTINEKVTADEQQQTVKEFTDLEGHVVLKRVMIAGDSLQTYYIYDSLSQLRGVIQPEGTNTLQAAAWVFPGGFNNLWMFLYRYDERKRMVMKKVPGADSVNMVYDQWDRVVLTQDGNMRAAHTWLFTKYDQLNRPVVTGQISDTRALLALQTDVTNSTGKFEIVSTSATEGYTLNGTFPSSGSYTLTVYSTTHYDSYSNLPTAWASNYSFINEYSVAAKNDFLNGQVVATQVRVLGTSNFNRTVTYYDDRYRSIQVIADNAAGGKDRITRILSFDGKVTSDYHNHTSRFFTTPLLTQQTYAYDHMDRVLSVTHKTAAQEVVTINQTAYNELGQPLNKLLHQSPSHPTSLQKVDYFYNIRGWVNGINRPLVTETGYEDKDFFAEDLHYNTSIIPGATAQYNGNISEQVYKVGYDEGETGYYYQYDQANRLTSSAWGFAWTNGGSSWGFSKRFDETGIGYDRNGNIKALTRYFGDWNVIDNLTYAGYSGNQLGKVSDAATPNLAVGFQDKDNAGGNDYIYDLNGNMQSDFNKSITSITYNYLNLPSVVTMTLKGTITYNYDAAGNKLQKTIVDQTASNKTTNYYYAGDYVYRNDTLEFIAHPEGRLRPVRIDTTQAISIANLKYIYDYYLKDHLGSVRSVLTTEQQIDLYAATMETATATKENALFNNVLSTATTKPAAMSPDNNNHQASKLNGAVGTAGNKRVGPSIVLKVMAGDTISISAFAWYTGPVQPATSPVLDIASELIPLLLNGVASQNGSKGNTIPTAFSDPTLKSDVNNFLTSGRTYDNTKPKAFLNWMVVGEDYTAVTSASHVNAKQILACSATDTMKQIIGLTNLTCKRNGWLYVYLSNESNQDVYFDNLVVNLKHGPLVEQKDYYAFGMENPALSTKALKQNYYENRRKFNAGSELQSKEFSDGSGLEEYATQFRMYDPQLGRWNSIDPKPDYSESLYSGMRNNPISFNDPLGDTLGISFRGGFLGLGKKQEVNYNNGSLTNKDGSAYGGKVKGFLKQTVNALNAASSGSAEAKTTLGALQGSNNNFTIVKGTENKFDYNSSQRNGAFANQLRTDPNLAQSLANTPASAMQGGSGGTITWNPSGANVWVLGGGQDNNPTANLMHELFHGQDANNGLLDSRVNMGLKQDEWQATYKENIFRQQTNAPLREFYRTQDNGGTLTPLPPRLLDANNNPIQ